SGLGSAGPGAAECRASCGGTKEYCPTHCPQSRPGPGDRYHLGPGWLAGPPVEGRRLTAWQLSEGVIPVDKPPVYRIVLAGGPCGGKSTSLASITDRLQGLGFQVYRVPEAATLLLGGGVSVRNTSPDRLVGIQAEMVRVIMALEDAFHTIASGTGRPSVLL